MTSRPWIAIVSAALLVAFVGFLLTLAMKSDHAYDERTAAWQAQRERCSEAVAKMRGAEKALGDPANEGNREALDEYNSEAQTYALVAQVECNGQVP